MQPSRWTISVLFLSTPSARRATELRLVGCCRFLFLSTPSARRATPGTPITFEEDSIFLSTPSARRATRHEEVSSMAKAFLSTPSARRATSLPTAREQPYQFLSTPSARRATNDTKNIEKCLQISIHALCEEGDGAVQSRAMHRPYFYPRPLRGGRLCYLMDGRWTTLISIHALCEEGDFGGVAYCRDCQNFYPRPLRGGRRHAVRCIKSEQKFLSTPSARRATEVVAAVAEEPVISIHALCEEGDVLNTAAQEPVSISIHALCEEGD